MGTRRTLRLLAVGALSIGVITVVAGALWMIGSASGTRDRFSSLEIAPSDSVFYMAINTEPSSSQWIAVGDTLGRLNAKESLREAIDKELLQFGLQFERDILPLAGEEGYIAITDVDALIDESGGFVAAFRLRDAAKAEEITLAVAESEGTDFTEEVYEGVTIRQSKGIASNNYQDEGALSFVNDVMIVGADPGDVKGVIDVIHGRAENATSDERLREMRERQEEDFLVWGYADMAPIWEAVESKIPADVSLDSEPIETPPPAPPRPEPQTGFRIPSFEADYRIGDGNLLVTERITVDFGETQTQGFNRDIATRMMYDFVYDVRASIGSLAVTRDGQTEPFDAVAIGDYYRVSIGDPAAALSGEHVYELQYTVQGTIVNVDNDDRTSLGRSYDTVWDVTGRNWGVPIEHASATVTISAESFLSFYCSVGPDPFPGVSIGCSDTQEGIQTMGFTSDGPIEPGDGMAFFAGVPGPSGIPDPELIPNGRLPFEPDVPTEEPPFPFSVDNKEIFDELRGTYDRVAFSISSMGDGFALNAAVLHQPGFEPKYAPVPAKAFDSRFASRLPADTMFFFAGSDLFPEGYLSGQDDYFDAGGDSQTISDIIQQFENELGFELEADLMSGEIAIAGNVSNIDTGGVPEFELLALAEVSDAARMENTMRKVGEYLERQDLAVVEESDLEGVHLWSLPQAPESAAWTVNDGDAILGYPESAVTQFLDPSGESLAATSDWERTMDLLPDDRTALGYVSLARVIEEVRQIEGTEAGFERSTEGKLTFDDLAPIRTLAYATTAAEDGFSARVVVLITD
jgi:hypothetical protein